jgi:hypothetical protein
MSPWLTLYATLHGRRDRQAVVASPNDMEATNTSLTTILGKELGLAACAKIDGCLQRRLGRQAVTTC